MTETEHIRASATIDASAEVLFEKIADYRSAEQLIDGLESLVPSSAATSGEGACFAAVMRVGPRTFNTTISISHYIPPSTITWSSSGKEPQALTFRFEPASGDVATKVTLEVSYERPGGLAGFVVARVVEQTVRAKARSTLEHLREAVT